MRIDSVSRDIRRSPRLTRLMAPSGTAPCANGLSSLLVGAGNVSRLLKGSVSRNRKLGSALVSFVDPSVPIRGRMRELSAPTFVRGTRRALTGMRDGADIVRNGLTTLSSRADRLGSGGDLTGHLVGFSDSLTLLGSSGCASAAIKEVGTRSASRVGGRLDGLASRLRVFAIPVANSSNRVVVMMALGRFDSSICSALHGFSFRGVRMNGIRNAPRRIVSDTSSHLLAVRSRHTTIGDRLETITRR